MRIRLADEDAPRIPCPVHGTIMLLEDWDSAYGQAVYLCQVEDCDEQHHTGPSDNDIYLREQGRL